MLLNMRLCSGIKGEELNPGDRKDSVAEKKYHFIGAGGVGMSALAMSVMNDRCRVTGSDQERSAITDRLCENGADIKIGHSSDNLPPDADAVVISAAIHADNVELAAAGEKGIKIYKYAEMLGKIMDRYDGIAFAGTHGKSTTSGWLAFVAERSGINPNFIVGADIMQLQAASGVGQSRIFIAEACEYDRSFLNLRPKVAVLLNIEQDHLDYYRDEDDIIDAFADFAGLVRPDGVIVANGDDGNVARMLEKISAGRRIVTFGLAESCDYSAQNVVFDGQFSRFDVYKNGSFLAQAATQLPGAHNISNALAVIAAGVAGGIEVEKIIEFLPEFIGMDRRIMLKGQIGEITVIDDYAHHPTEIRASLEAIRARYRPERLYCVFQPHQYSRTRFLLEDFAASFSLADITIVPEIYFVRDTTEAKKEVNSEVLVERIGDNGSDAIFIDSFKGICEYLKDNVQSGQLVVTMGAGNIWKVADEYIQWLRGNRQI